MSNLEEKLAPRPFCGEKRALSFEEGRTTCEICLGYIIDWPLDEVWENAYCWKRIAELEAELKSQREVVRQTIIPDHALCMKVQRELEAENARLKKVFMEGK